VNLVGLLDNEPYEINGSMNERANFENNAYYSQTQRSKYNRPFKVKIYFFKINVFID
jgi:hypothetical protein